MHARYATLLELRTIAMFLAHLHVSDLDTAMWMAH